MAQSTNPSSSSMVYPKAITDVDMVSLSSSSASKPSPSGNNDDFGLAQCAERCESDGEKTPDRLVTLLKTPQAWDPELTDFDFAASPGAEEWQIGETADGRAVYSTVGGTGDGVTVEFQKWDW